MNRTYTVLQWCEIFGIELIDNDGFRGVDIKKIAVRLPFFVNGIISCTINPINRDKYAVLNAIL